MPWPGIGGRGRPAGRLERAAGDRRCGNRLAGAAEYQAAGGEGDAARQHHLQEFATGCATTDGVFDHRVVGSGPIGDLVFHVIPLLVWWREARLLAGLGPIRLSQLRVAATASARPAMEVK
jgi:hypothetical protein